MNNQTFAAFRRNAITPLIVGGAIIVAVPTFIFCLTRFVYLGAIKELLAPAAQKQLATWRMGGARSLSRPRALMSLTASTKDRWLPASIRQITTVLDRINRRKGI